MCLLWVFQRNSFCQEQLKKLPMELKHSTHLLPQLIWGAACLAVRWTQGRQGGSWEADGKMEEDARSHRNYRYSLFAAARRRQQQTCYILSWLTQRMQRQGRVRCAYIGYAHAQCYKWSQLLQNHYSQNVGQEQEAVGVREPDHHHLGQLLFPYTAHFKMRP